MSVSLRAGSRKVSPAPLLLSMLSMRGLLITGERIGMPFTGCGVGSDG
jgi:hypothetical protein